MAARVGVAGAVVGAVEAEDDAAGGDVADRLDLAGVEAAALSHLRVEVVAGDVGRDRQQVGDLRFGEDRVEAAEGLGAEPAVGVEGAGVGELVDPHQHPRRARRLGGEGVAAKALQRLDHALLPAQPPRLHGERLAEAQRLAGGQAWRQPPRCPGSGRDLVRPKLEGGAAFRVVHGAHDPPAGGVSGRRSSLVPLQGY
jgi:hypothetical protein